MFYCDYIHMLATAVLGHVFIRLKSMFFDHFHIVKLVTFGAHIVQYDIKTPLASSKLRAPVAFIMLLTAGKREKARKVRGPPLTFRAFL